MKKQKPIEEIIALVLLLFISIQTGQAQVVESELCVGGNGDDKIIDVRPTSDSGTLLIIETRSNDGDFPDNHGGKDVGLIKLNKQREIEWKQCLGSSMDDIYESFDTFGDNYLITYSYFDTSGMGNNPYSPLIQNVRVFFQADGGIIWSHKQHSINGGLWGFYHHCIPTKDKGAFITSGQYDTTTTTIIARLNQNGDTLWQDKIDQHLHSTWYWDINKVIYFSWELQDSSILVFENLRNQGIGGFPSNQIDTISYSIRRHYSKSGELLSVDTFSNTTPIKYMQGEPIWENDSILYLFTYKNLVAECPAFSIAGFRKSDLSLASEFEFGYGTDRPRQFYDSDIRQLSLKDQTIYLDENPYDSIHRLLFHKYTFTGELAWSVELDSSAASYIPVTQVIFLEAEHAVLVFYMKGNTEFFCKISEQGHLLFSRPYLEIPSNYYHYNGYLHDWYDLYNIDPYHFQPCFRQAEALPNNLYHISNNQLYSSFMYVGTDNSVGNYQPIQVTDLNTGATRLIYENISAQNSYTLFKFLKPLDRERLFAAYDLRGTHKCRLGDYDIVFSQIVFNGNSVSGAAFIDYNNNHLKEGNEPWYTLSNMESKKGNTAIASSMYGKAYTTLYTDNGVWTTRILPPTPYYTITPATFITAHEEYGYADTIMFSLYPSKIIKDLSLSLVNTFITRLGQEATYDITYANNGTHLASGSVKLLLDPRLSFQSAIPAISAQNGDTLSWNFNNLQAGGVSKISINVLADIPPALNGGDTLHHMAWILPASGDTTPGDNVSLLNEVILTSYDPNDKLTTSGKDITPQQIDNGEYITYVIRFQNTGDDTAFRVVLEDTLDSRLDWNSLQLTGASHPFSMQINNGNIIHFTFSPIKLPPSGINEPKSHGYVSYRVKVKKDAPVGYTVKNTAHIYFDYNAPISTATVNTRIITLTAIHSSIPDENQFSIFPNPGMGLFNLQLNKPLTSGFLQLVDLNGQIVYQKHISGQNQKIDVRGLAAGMYALQVRSGDMQFTEKIIIE